MCIVRFFVLLLVIAGALNWGLWGIFQYDVVADMGEKNNVAKEHPEILKRKDRDAY